MTVYRKFTADALRTHCGDHAKRLLVAVPATAQEGGEA